MSGSDSHRFKVALSFSGEHRDYICILAKCLHERLNLPGSLEKDGCVFYDYWFEGELNGPGLDTVLQNIYNQESLMVVVGMAHKYGEKPWCLAEWEAIRALYFSLRGSPNGRDRIFYLRFDDVDISGIWSINGYTDARQRTPDQVADLLVERLERLGQKIAPRRADWRTFARTISENTSRLADYFVPTFLRKHPFASILIPLAVVGLVLVWKWYLFIPAKVAIDYYNAIGQKEYERAWGHTAESLRTKRFSTLEDFKNLYGTTEPPASMRVEVQPTSLLDIFTLLASETRQVTIKYEMYERFTKEQLAQPFQKENRLWVQIYHKNDFPRLMDGTLETPEGTLATSLAIRRYFEEAIVLKHENGEWKIVSIQKNLRGLKRLSD